jgi:hypothetical protein
MSHNKGYVALELAMGQTMDPSISLPWHHGVPKKLNHPQYQMLGGAASKKLVQALKYLSTRPGKHT